MKHLAVLLLILLIGISIVSDVYFQFNKTKVPIIKLIKSEWTCTESFKIKNKDFCINYKKIK
jgi:sporulation protein YlmC with PRC-barrel domain